ncbi:hypothetical protein BT96DRAFT_1017895 [Gymnopus androsaceus JB14]|uniref:Protein kinase domain-containing protein n=1 Tax=Gymnopus androsaceus JB14 TaxID=1447944 RepID=A0A6A4HW16_9AGAR|nr:hypothetical protein BT96DRAFT_1017895 [Gymnopus androsaceus JB14]
MTSAHSYVYNLYAPFGSWPADCISPMKAEDKRYLSYGSDYSDLNSLARQLKIMEYAGDCAVDLIWRLYATDKQKVIGIVMPCEVVINPPSIPKDERIRLIYDLRDLTQRFHKRGLVHGDIKPENLLRCSPGYQLRFCDFGTSSVLKTESSPCTLADDYLALAMSMWEIYE